MTRINTQGQRIKSVEQRFKEKRSESDGCWEWTSAIGSRGYGIFWAGSLRKSVMAHRYALEMELGHPVPDRMVVMHSCDNPKCVNPAHLSIGTELDNSKDAARKGRLATGERNGGGGKLRVSDVEFIRSSVGLISGAELARRMSVSRYLVNAIRSGQIWKSVQVT